MRISARRGALLALTIALCAAAFAQTEPPPAPQFAEEIEVRVIDVDVVVTDRHGNPMMNLTRDHFELYEDGKRVDVAYFSRVVDGRLADLPAGTTAATGPQPRMPLTWVIFIDHTNVHPSRRNQAMRQLQQFLQRSVTGGDRGVVALNDGRAFRIRQGLTEDPQLLMATLARLEKERMSVSPTMNRTNQILGQMRRSEADWGASGGGPGIVRDEDQFMAQTAGNDIQMLIEEEATRTRNAIMSMGALLDTLAQVEGRLALVYVGAGFNAHPLADLTATWRTRYSKFVGEPYEPHPERERDTIQREITRLHNNLSALRVTVYTIHAGDPGGGPTSVEDSGQLEASVASSTDIGALSESGHAREMAQRTGGLYFKANQQLASQLEAVRRDLGNYYSLGYKPAGDPGKARRVQVKVKAEGVSSVRHRETVRERTRQERAAGAVVAATVQPQPRTVQKAERREPVLAPGVVTAANPLGVRVEADLPRPEGWERERLLHFRFAIQLEALTFVRQGNAHRASFAMHFSLVGNDGAVYPLESRDQSLAIPEAELANGQGMVNYAWHVDLPPLRIPQGVPMKEGMRLNAIVEDRTSGVRSVITVPVGKASA